MVVLSKSQPSYTSNQEVKGLLWDEHVVTTYLKDVVQDVPHVTD